MLRQLCCGSICVVRVQTEGSTGKILGGCNELE